MAKAKFSEGEKVKITNTGLYDGRTVKVAHVGEDAGGETVYIVNVKDPTTERMVNAGFSESELEKAGGES